MIMNNINLGYACINMELSNAPKAKRITTNRSMIKRTFKSKGIEYASELGLENCRELFKIIKWNNENGFKSRWQTRIGNRFYRRYRIVDC